MAEGRREHLKILRTKIKKIYYRRRVFFRPLFIYFLFLQLLTLILLCLCRYLMDYYLLTSWYILGWSTAAQRAEIRNLASALTEQNDELERLKDDLMQLSRGPVHPQYFNYPGQLSVVKLSIEREDDVSTGVCLLHFSTSSIVSLVYSLKNQNNWTNKQTRRKLCSKHVYLKVFI